MYKKLFILLIILIFPIISHANLDDDLYYALRKRDLNKIKHLVERGANVNAKKRGWPLLHLAVAQGNQTPVMLNIIKYLIKKGADVNGTDTRMRTTALFGTCVLGTDKIAKLLIDLGANVNFVSKGGITPLHLSAEVGSINVTKVLIQKGANVNAKDDTDSTPLHGASEWNRLAIAKLLVKHGANKSAKIAKGHKKGKTPYDLARSTDMKQLLKSE